MNAFFTTFLCRRPAAVPSVFFLNSCQSSPVFFYSHLLTTMMKGKRPRKVQVVVVLGNETKLVWKRRWIWLRSRKQDKHFRLLHGNYVVSLLEQWTVLKESARVEEIVKGFKHFSSTDHKTAFRGYIEDGKAINNMNGKSDSAASPPKYNGHSSKS